MRDAVNKIGGDTERINPLCPVDLVGLRRSRSGLRSHFARFQVIDHSIQVDAYGK